MWYCSPVFFLSNWEAVIYRTKWLGVAFCSLLLWSGLLISRSPLALTFYYFRIPFNVLLTLPLLSCLFRGKNTAMTKANRKGRTDYHLDSNCSIISPLKCLISSIASYVVMEHCGEILRKWVWMHCQFLSVVVCLTLSERLSCSAVQCWEPCWH